LRFLPANRVAELSPEEQAIYRQLDPARLPQHVAIIMDGNGRWAGKRSLKRFLGHQQGAESVQYVVETASRINLPWLTLYAFSLENNLRRPKTCLLYTSFPACSLSGTPLRCMAVLRPRLLYG